MMDRGHDRDAELSNSEHPVAEALDVVDDVVADARADSRGQLAKRAHAERERLGQEAEVARGELVEVERLRNNFV